MKIRYTLGQLMIAVGIAGVVLGLAVKTSKGLAKITRSRADLERRVGEASPSKLKTEGALDQIEKVAGVVRQVQDEVVNFGRIRRDVQPDREPARRPLAGTALLRVGDHIVNPDEIVRISPAGELFRVDFTGGDPLVLNKKLFEELEKQLPIRGR